jgi:DNA-damage-inducible protein D
MGSLLLKEGKADNRLTCFFNQPSSEPPTTGFIVDERVKQDSSLFDSAKQVTVDGDEYWSARDLSELLDYTEWRSFNELVERAITSLREAGGDPTYHFVPGHKMIPTGKGATRSVKDYQLSRLGSYLVAMNGDPSQKSRVAEAQNYFAQKTRLQELNEAYQEGVERLREWSKYDESDRQLNDAITEAGISPRGLDQIRNGGDREFFGGLDKEDMAILYGLGGDEELTDRMPTVLLSAKSFTNQMTKWKIENIGLYGVEAIDEEHIEHNRLNRQTLVDEGMVPEELPPEKESIKDIQKSIEGVDKRHLADNT